MTPRHARPAPILPAGIAGAGAGASRTPAPGAQPDRCGGAALAGATPALTCTAPDGPREADMAEEQAMERRARAELGARAAEERTWYARARAAEQGAGDVASAMAAVVKAAEAVKEAGWAVKRTAEAWERAAERSGPPGRQGDSQ